MKRGRSIRRQLFAMLSVALVALVGLYVFALAAVIKPVLEQRVASIADRDVRTPGSAAVAALQAERKAAELYLAGGRTDAGGLNAARANSDVAVARFRRLLSGSELRKRTDRTGRKITETIDVLDKLPASRQAVDNSTNRVAARLIYTNVVWSVLELFDALPASVTPEATHEQSGDTAVARVLDQMSEEDAVVAGLSVARRYTPLDAAAFTLLIGGMGNQVQQAKVLLSGELKTQVDKLLGASVAQRVYAINDAIVAKGFNGGVPPLDVATWEGIYRPAIAQVATFLESVHRDVDKYKRNAANSARLQLALTGIGGLLVVALSLFLAIRLGRSLAVRLAGLRASALDLANVRLPDVVARLRRGQPVDAAAEAPPLSPAVDEIGQVAEAFNRVRRTAIESAVQEAYLRQGINQFFVNIARRSQGLLHRQLALLDKMERRTTEPDELENLFRVDHLATRMRRNAEDLIILAGKPPGRGWRQPVPMIDVIRGAVSEVEDYARVNLSVMGEEALVGRAVNDVTHLLAELIENGANYSPPHTHVGVAGQAVGNGFAVEIEDRGLGMGADTLATVNRQLLDPPDFNPANSAQLGLFVVARLAAKHGIRVQLRPSLFGGVTAIVLIPTELIAVRAEQHQTRPVIGRAAAPQLPDSDTRHPAANGHNAAAPAEPGGGATFDLQDRFTWLGNQTTSTAVTPAPAAPSSERRRLPRRVRQANLAPQLQDAPAPGPDPVQVPIADSPEAIRTRMTAFQRGTDRGRRVGTAGTEQQEELQ
jgi:signal transduction histidine kinase